MIILFSLTVCFEGDSCDGPGIYADNMTDCGRMGGKHFKDPMTFECLSCDRKFIANVKHHCPSIIVCVSVTIMCIL